MTLRYRPVVRNQIHNSQSQNALLVCAFCKPQQQHHHHQGLISLPSVQKSPLAPGPFPVSEETHLDVSKPAAWILSCNNSINAGTCLEKYTCLFGMLTFSVWHLPLCRLLTFFSRNDAIVGGMVCLSRRLLWFMTQVMRDRWVCMQDTNINQYI